MFNFDIRKESTIIYVYDAYRRAGRAPYGMPQLPSAHVPRGVADAKRDARNADQTVRGM